MKQTRRDFLKRGALTCACCAGWTANRMSSNFNTLCAQSPAGEPIRFYPDGVHKRIDAPQRVFHVSAAVEMFEECPDLPDIWKEAGITDAWICTWFYGYFPYPWEKIDYWLKRIIQAGLQPHLISVPFCHGGGALDPRTEGFPNLPPEHWKIAKRWNGSENWGFSWHEPTDTEGADAIRTLVNRYGSFDYFLDDDFRFASAPGDIGGCVCEQCRADFFKTSEINPNRWDELMTDLQDNRDTALRRAWCDYFCDRLTYCFRAFQNASDQVDLGIMVMYMGCERNGIRLDDYRDALFRVGEGGFNDGWYDPIAAKTIELFSSLLHRRFCAPGRAFSETTVFPAGTLSVENMASKLSVSTLSDVRNTCFMSGLRPIEPEFWPVLNKRMQSERQFHAKLLNQKPKGPFKHYYGSAARYCAGENAYSLFLACGVPFEVCDELPNDGYVFLADADANAVERGAVEPTGAKLIARFQSQANRFTAVAEQLEALFEFRRAILLQLQEQQIPYVEEEIPIVLAWYPDVNLVYLWNLSKEDKTFHLRCGEKLVALKIKDRDSLLIDMAQLA
ncbi:MAG: twin-arginine translocation signal domain-containing protein [Planctomycetia bacterium]|nr:twin-arginine translocation signal domain-containing protein [Planctomycetia bacterium]